MGAHDETLPQAEPEFDTPSPPEAKSNPDAQAEAKQDAVHHTFADAIANAKYLEDGYTVARALNYSAGAAVTFSHGYAYAKRELDAKAIHSILSDPRNEISDRFYPSDGPPF